MGDDEFCMKGKNFYYVLDDPLASMIGYQNLASTELGKKKLSANGHLDFLLLIYAENNNAGLILPSRGGETFGGTGPIYPVGERKTVEEASELIRSRLVSWNKLYKGEPRAIVYAGREKEFIEVANALGMKPVKLSEKMFSEGINF